MSTRRARTNARYAFALHTLKENSGDIVLQVYQIHVNDLEVIAKSPLQMQHRLPPTIPKGIVMPRKATASDEATSTTTTPGSLEKPLSPAEKRKLEKQNADASGSEVKRPRQKPARSAKTTDAMDE